MKPLAIFVRHSESTGNAENVVKGVKNYALNEKGKRETKLIGAKIAKYKPTVVVTSPLRRASAAGISIGKHSGAEVKVDKGLLPQNFGTLTGTPRKTGEPIISKMALQTPNKKMPGGESFNHWLGKNDAAMRRVKVMINKGERPAVVTHSRNLRELKHSLHGAKPADPTRGGPEPSGYVTLSRSQKLKMHAPPTKKVLSSAGGK